MDEVFGALKARLITILTKDERAWERLNAKLELALTRAWSLGFREAAAQAMRMLRATPKETFDPRLDEARILRAFEQAVGPDIMPRLMEGPVATLSEAIWAVGATEAARPAGVDFRFDIADREALALARRGDLYWIGRSWDAFTRQQLSDAVMEYFERGMTYAQMAERMQAAFDGIEERGMRYWELAADAMATKTREMGRISGYEQAGTRFVQVVARMDERTTAICRSMHGRIIAVERLSAQRQRYLDAISRGHLEAAHAAWPMLPHDFDVSQLSGGRLPENIGLPPYHFRCRTRTVAYFGRDH